MDSPQDPRFHVARLESALYVHLNDESKYQAVLDRVRALALAHGRIVSWVLAQDKCEELRRLDSDKRLERAIRFWQRPDMDTKGVLGLLSLKGGGVPPNSTKEKSAKKRLFLAKKR